ncbi:MAG: hypothetical protein ABJB47_00765 [Actinomycetota bacterium]
MRGRSFLLPPWPAVPQSRVLFLHGEHASGAHGPYRHAIEHPRLVAEGAWRQQPVRPSPEHLAGRPIWRPVEVGGAEVGTVPGELAGFLGRLRRQGRGASFHEDCLRPLGVDARDPELDVAVLARDPADPRIEAPAPEQPGWDAGCFQRIDHCPDGAQLCACPFVHRASLPRAPLLDNRFIGWCPW